MLLYEFLVLEPKKSNDSLVYQNQEELGITGVSSVDELLEVEKSLINLTRDYLDLKLLYGRLTLDQPGRRPRLTELKYQLKEMTKL